MHREQMEYAARLVRLAARELSAPDASSPAEVTRYAALADRLGFLDSTEPGNRTDLELLAESPVVVLAGRFAVTLVELLARHLTPHGPSDRWDDADLVELAKLLLHGQNWRFPEPIEDQSQQSLGDGLEDIAPSPGITPGAR